MGGETKTVLLCRPLSRYPVMLKEFNHLKNFYQKNNIKVHEIKQHQGAKDMVFVANAGVVYNNIFIPSHFREEHRKAEVAYVEEFFEKKGFRIERLPWNIYFEGEGDVIIRHGHAFFGHGIRSEKRALPYLEKIMNRKLIDISLHNKKYFHLDTCFAPLDENIALINPSGLTRNEIKKIVNNFDIVIQAGKQDDNPNTCNVMCHNNKLIFGVTLSKQLQALLHGFEFETHILKFEAFERKGGAIKCLTLEFLS